MNLSMQQVPIKLIRAIWNIVDVPNYKFDEIIVIIDETFAHLKAQAPTAKAYNSLSKHINMRFQRVL